MFQRILFEQEPVASWRSFSFPNEQKADRNQPTNHRGRAGRLRAAGLRAPHHDQHGEGAMDGSNGTISIRRQKGEPSNCMAWVRQKQMNDFSQWCQPVTSKCQDTSMMRKSSSSHS